MLNKLKALNPNIKIYDIHSAEFKKYGHVLSIDTHEIVFECEKITRPENGSEYILSVPELENLSCSAKIRELSFGGCPAQIGLCHGSNSCMNALEFHKSSECVFSRDGVSPC